MEEDEWKKINFKSDLDGKVLLDGLIPNRTYAVKMFVTGGAIQGALSNSATFTTNSTALASVKTDPNEEYTADPQTNEPLSIKCTVKSATQASVLWKVNGGCLKDSVTVTPLFRCQSVSGLELLHSRHFCPRRLYRVNNPSKVPH